MWQRWKGQAQARIAYHADLCPCLCQCQRLCLCLCQWVLGLLWREVGPCLNRCPRQSLGLFVCWYACGSQ